jgi:thiol-disulfide isomerase/thioredoxin
MQRISLYYRLIPLLFFLLCYCLEISGQQKDVANIKLSKLNLPNTKTVTIKGNLKRLNVSSTSAMDVFTFQYRDLLTGKMAIVPIDKDSAGNFSTTIPLNGYQQLQLNQSHKYGDQIEQEGMIEFLFYARPGEDMELNYYVSEDFKTRSVKFGGNLAEVNNQNRSYQNELETTEFDPLVKWQYIDSLPSSAYPQIKQHVTERLKASLAYNARYFASIKADPYVRKQADADMRYSAATALVYAAHRRKIVDTALSGFFDKHHIKLNDPEFYSNDRYKIFLDFYYVKLKDEYGKIIHQTELKLPEISRYLLNTQPDLVAGDKALAIKMADTNYKVSDEEKRQAAERLALPYMDEYEYALAVKSRFNHFMNISDPFLRETFATKCLSEVLEKKEVTVIKELIDVYRARVRPGAFKNNLLEQYQTEYARVYESKLSPGTVLNEAKNISLDSLISNLVSKHRGKVIYLDVWATWCQPCLAEMGNSRLLREKFKGKNVAFIYICTRSKSQSQWKNLIAANQMEGDHYFLDESQSDALLKRFSINVIPRYMIYDKNGSLKNGEAARPGNVKAFEEINSVM